VEGSYCWRGKYRPLVTGAKLPELVITLAVTAIGFLGYGVSLVLFVRALRHLGAARTGAHAHYPDMHHRHDH
jgi:hypothetical protein